jgi:hypothetical protein
MNLLNLKWLKIYISGKIIGRKSEDKNINKIENIENNGKAKSVNSDLVYIIKQLFHKLSSNMSDSRFGAHRLSGHIGIGIFRVKPFELSPPS